MTLVFKKDSTTISQKVIKWRANVVFCLSLLLILFSRKTLDLELLSKNHFVFNVTFGQFNASLWNKSINQN